MQTLNFNVTYQEADLIATCLGKAPYEVTSQLIEKLKQQCAPQLIKPEPKTPEEPPEPKNPQEPSE